VLCAIALQVINDGVQNVSEYQGYSQWVTKFQKYAAVRCAKTPRFDKFASSARVIHLLMQKCVHPLPHALIHKIAYWALGCTKGFKNLIVGDVLSWHGNPSIGAQNERVNKGFRPTG